MGHGGRHIHIGASFRAAHDWLVNSGVDWSHAPTTRNALLQEFGDWSTELTDLIRNCDDTIIPRLIYALPTGHSWPRIPGVTLLGDAAHIMSPFAGEGANLAMLDATELALAIVEHRDNLETALTTYESAMFPRAAAAAEASAKGLELCFAADAPRGIVEFFSQMGAPAPALSVGSSAKASDDSYTSSTFGDSGRRVDGVALSGLRRTTPLRVRS